MSKSGPESRLDQPAGQHEERPLTRYERHPHLASPHGETGDHEGGGGEGNIKNQVQIRDKELRNRVRQAGVSGLR